MWHGLDLYAIQINKILNFVTPNHKSNVENKYVYHNKDSKTEEILFKEKFSKCINETSFKNLEITSNNNSSLNKFDANTQEKYNKRKYKKSEFPLPPHHPIKNK